MLVNLTKFFDPKALAAILRSKPNPTTMLLDALFGGAGGRIHPNIKVSVASDEFETENVPHSTRQGTPYIVSETSVKVKELAPPPHKLLRTMTASELNDIESMYRSSGLGSAQSWAADLVLRFRNKFIKSAQAMAAEYLKNQGSIMFHNHQVGGGVTTTTYAYPNSADWNTFTPAAVWSGLTIIAIYDDLRAMADQMLVAHGFGGPYTVICASNVYSQVLGKVQAYASTASFNIAIQDNYIQLGSFKIYDVVGTFKNWTTAAGTAEALITTKKIYMLSDESERDLLWCRMDVIRGNRTFIDGTMDVWPFYDELNDRWILKGQSKPFVKINPASIIEATVLT